MVDKAKVSRIATPMIHEKNLLIVGDYNDDVQQMERVDDRAELLYPLSVACTLTLKLLFMLNVFLAVALS